MSMLSKTYFFLFAIIFSVEFTQGKTLSCVDIGDKTWHIANQNGKTIGTKGVCFSTHTECERAIDNQHGNLVCSWNGQTYQPYNAENGQALGIDDASLHFTKMGECIELIKSHPANSPFLCAWNGKYYSPYERKTNLPLPADEVGWKKSNECIAKSIKPALDNLICSWNKEPTLFDIKGNVISTNFKTMDDCNRPLQSMQLMKKLDIQNKLSDSKNIKAFQNATPNETVGFDYWKKCEVREHAYHLSKNKDGYIVPECTPDTLYSWGGFDKLLWFLQNLPDKSPWPEKLSRTLYTTSTAAGTFGYGPLPLRFKIKPQVKFKLLINPSTYTCESYISTGVISEDELTSTIPVRLKVDSNLSLLEFDICSAQVIESWSFAMPDHYDEILQDHTWMTSKNYFNWESYAKKDGVDLYLDSELDAGNK